MATQLLNVPKIVVYSDVNIDVIDDGPFELVFNADAIKKALENIFLTPYGSRVFRRKFGSKIMDLMFDPCDSYTAAKVETLIRETVTQWETRISNLKLIVLPDVANQQYYVEMRYSIPGLSDKMVNYKFNISK